MDVLRAASKLSSEGSLDGLQADTATTAIPDTKAVEAAAGEGALDTAAVVEGRDEVLSGLGLLSGELVMGLAGIKDWIMESLAALVQVRLILWY